MRSKCQCVELRCCRRNLAFSAVELVPLDCVHQFNAGNEDARTAKGLESEHRPHDAFDRAVVLLQDVVEVSALTQLDACARCSLHAQDGSRIGAALVHGDLLGHIVQANGPLQETTCSSAVSLGTQHEGDRVAIAVDLAVQVLPLAGDLEIGLVHAPTGAPAVCVVGTRRSAPARSPSPSDGLWRDRRTRLARPSSLRCAAGSAGRPHTSARTATSPPAGSAVA